MIVKRAEQLAIINKNVNRMTDDVLTGVTVKPFFRQLESSTSRATAHTTFSTPPRQ